MGKVIKFRIGKDEIQRKRNNMREFIKLVLYLVNNCSKEIYRTKLNKLLFYTQFLYYKENREKLIEDNFYYDYFGPVLKDLDEKLEKLEEADIISLSNDDYGTIIQAQTSIDNKLYTKKEREILDKVIKKFDNWSSKKVSNYSHEEEFWENYEKGEIIDISNALTLRNVDN
ncbi:MAG: Panacea domain-containing protein [Clostridium baratii]